ncbi:MAG: hypothetical protein GX074_04405 [Erysipelothrix sp.]|nr:hypothetical protein [Erysipelothrix sp.]
MSKIKCKKINVFNRDEIQGLYDDVEWSLYTKGMDQLLLALIIPYWYMVLMLMKSLLV